MYNTTSDINSILSKIGIKELNPMQKATLNAFEENNNTILLSNTGTGKTLAFLLSILKQLENSFTDDNNLKTKVLIIAPSRELAIQIEKVFKSLGVNFKVSSCYGGHKRETEENNLIEAPSLIIGTPGRLADHLRRGNIKTDGINTLVIDEFDKLLEQNFNDEMDYIIKQLKNIDKKVLTSATQLDEFPNFLQLQNPIILNYLVPEISEKLEIQLLNCEEKDKLEECFKLLCKIGGRSTIIFCNHRESVERVSGFLTTKGINNEFYHGAMEQQERDSALCKFRNGTVYFLVTTDLASRGLDIPNIRNIIHYHLPHTEDTFTHRNGRTARVEASGTAIIMLSPEEKLPNFIESDLTEINLPDNFVMPDKPKWSTLFIAAGKKDKVNKIDIVGFFSNKGNLKQEDIGLIEVKDFFSFVAIKKIHVSETLQRIKDQKIKGKKVKIVIAK